MSKSDPYVEIYMKKIQGSHVSDWFKVGKTETIKDSLNPDFSKSIELLFNFEMQQPIKFVVYDDDGSGDRDFIGQHETSLNTLVGAPNQCYAQHLQKPGSKESRGQIAIRVEPVDNSNVEV